jgi:uncharacterized protein (DUF1499 family)
MLKAILFSLLALICIICAVMFYRVARTPMPVGFGAGEELKACSTDRPNCVSSFNSEQDFGAAPLALTGSVDEMRTKLLAALGKEGKEGKLEIVHNNGVRIDVVFRSAFFSFPDDASFLLDVGRQQVQFHSKARIGYSDLGVNRKRIERIRAALR